MELPKYAVPESLLSPQSLPSSRGGQTLREQPNEIDDPDRHGKVTGKRKRAGVGLASLKSVSGRIGHLQYAVPESLMSPQTIYSSRDLTFQATLNEIVDLDRHDNIITNSHQESMIPVHSRSEPGYPPLDAHCGAQNNAPLPPSTSVKQPEELVRTMTPTRRSLDRSPDLAFETTSKDLGIKYDCLSGISQDTFFPTPAMTDPSGEAHTPNLSWNSAPDLPFLLDGIVSSTDPEAAVAGAAPGRCEIASDRVVPVRHRAVNTGVPPLRGESQLDTSAPAGARLSHVLKAVNAAGFDSLDDAVIAYYMESLTDDERLRQEQRLNRIRRLPVLVKKLHLAAQGWGQWQRRGFQEQIIKSTEDIVIAELEDHLAARRPDRYNSACSSDQPGQAGERKATDETNIGAELPNTWTLLTSLSTKYNAIASKDCQADMPKLVSKFFTAGTDLGT